MLYCITSSNYRTLFFRMVSCGCFRGGAGGGPVDQSNASRTGMSRGRTPTPSRRSSIGAVVKRKQSTPSGIGSMKSPAETHSSIESERFLSPSPNPKQIAAGAAHRSPHIYQKARLSNRYSLPAYQIGSSSQEKITIDERPACAPLTFTLHQLKEEIVFE